MKAPKTKNLPLLSETDAPETSKALSDERIVKEVKAGNIQQFEVLVHRYNQQLFRIVRSYLSYEEDVKDIMQTAYLKTYDNLHQFRGEPRFSTWLIRITINEALTLLKKKRRTSELESGTGTINQDRIHRSGVHNPETKAIHSDMNNYLEQAIDRLPSSYRRVLIMREIEQMSTKETADCLNMTRVNVKVRLHRAKDMLKEELLQIVKDADVFRFKGDRCDAMIESVMREIRDR